MTKELTTKKESLPSFIQKDAPARGSENVGTDDIVIPRLLLLQQLSPQLDKTDALYIEGASAGDICNSLTGVNYGSDVTIVPIYFRKEYVVWKDRKKGGGFCGTYATRADAERAIAELEPPTADYAAEDTATQFVLVVNADGSLDQAMLTLSKTKLSFSRKLQSLIRLTEQDSFATKYSLATVAVSNDLGKFHNFTATSQGYVNEETYYAGEACYKAIVESDVKMVPHDGPVVVEEEATSF